MKEPLRIVIFSHPDYLQIRSINRFSQMLHQGFTARGHQVELVKPQPVLYNEKINPKIRKWLGYLDQYFFFRFKLKAIRRNNKNNNVLYVFADNALGPWVPVFAGQKHVVHCHDFMALRSSLGLIKENPTSSTGKIYQSYIRRGFAKASNFISVSEKTKHELEDFVERRPKLSEVVYNGLSPKFTPKDIAASRGAVGKLCNAALDRGYIMHIGTNVWYKNKPGVVDIYLQWRKIASNPLPLVMIGGIDDPSVQSKIERSGFAKDIHILGGVTDEDIAHCYSGASLLLFPSLDEGFGWPIAEAMACGCLVMTTGKAPMTEVGGDVAYYIPRKTEGDEWAENAALSLEAVMNEAPEALARRRADGMNWVKQFNIDKTLDHIEEIYGQAYAMPLN